MGQNEGTCKLCLTPSVELRCSHFVPKFMYKLLRQGGQQNPNPVRITKSGAAQTSWQATSYVLCRECEYLLSKGGETYISRICWRSKKDFKLRKLLQSARPIQQGGPNQAMKVFTSSTIPELNMSKLIYFGASILWRASLWSSLYPDLHQASLDAESQERFRLFLKGETGFPSNATIILTIVDLPRNDKDPEFGRMVIFPYKNELIGSRMYRFLLCGLSYQFEIDFRPNPRIGQATSFPGDMIFLAPWDDIGTIRDSMGLMSRL